MPGSVTSSTRLADNSAANSPARSTAFTPNTNLVRGMKSKETEPGELASASLAIVFKSGELEGPAPIQEFKHISLVWLIPRNPHRWNRAEVEALDEGRFQQRFTKSRILRDRRDHQR